MSEPRRIAGIVAVALFVAVGLGTPDALASPAPPVPGRAPRVKAPKGFPVPARPAADAPLPPPLTWLTAAQTAGGGVISKHGALQSLAGAQALLRTAQHAVRDVRDRIADLRVHITAMQKRLVQLERKRRTLVVRERTRAIAVYMDGSGTLDQFLPATGTPAEGGRRAVYANASQGLDTERLDNVVQEQARRRRSLAGLQQQLDVAHADLAVARTALATALRTFVAVRSFVSDPLHGGRVFPVDGAFDFGDSWNAFRAVGGDGTQAHHATDIMAKKGTPVVAIETGTIGRIGWNRLGGWRLWILGASGTEYYYAHLRAYAPRLHTGSKVIAGQYLGRVGNTGDARGGPTHLHFEVHIPGAHDDTVTVNPYPLLCLLTGAAVPLIPASEPKPKALKPPVTEPKAKPKP